MSFDPVTIYRTRDGERKVFGHSLGLVAAEVALCAVSDPQDTDSYELEFTSSHSSGRILNRVLSPTFIVGGFSLTDALAKVRYYAKVNERAPKVAKIMRDALFGEEIVTDVCVNFKLRYELSTQQKVSVRGKGLSRENALSQFRLLFGLYPKATVEVSVIYPGSKDLSTGKAIRMKMMNLSGEAAINFLEENIAISHTAREAGDNLRQRFGKKI